MIPNPTEKPDSREENGLPFGERSPSVRNEVLYRQLSTLTSLQKSGSFVTPAIIWGLLILFTESGWPLWARYLWGGIALGYGVGTYISHRAFIHHPQHVRKNLRMWVNIVMVREGINGILFALIPAFLWSQSEPFLPLYGVLIITGYILHNAVVVFFSRRIFLVTFIPCAASNIMAAILLTPHIDWSLLLIQLILLPLFLSIAHQSRKKSIQTELLAIDNQQLVARYRHQKNESIAAKNEAEQANSALGRREELFRALIENAQDGMILTDRQGYIRYLSPYMEQIGYDRKIYLGSRLVDLFTPDKREEFTQFFRKKESRTRGIMSITDHIQTPGDDRIWIETTISDLRSNPSIGGFIVNIRDVTLRRQASEKLNQNLEILNALAHDAELHVIMNRLIENMERPNPALQAALITLDPLSRKREVIAPSLPIHFRSFLEEPLSPVQQTLLNRKNEKIYGVVCHTLQTTSLNPLLKQAALESNIGSFWTQPITSRRGKLLGLVLVCRAQTQKPTRQELSVTDSATRLAALAIERKLHERDLLQAMEKAEIANRAKSQFLATMSHELRTPLNAVIGFSEIMADEIFGPIGVPQYRDYAKDIFASGKHLLAVIDDILDLSKIEAGRYELEKHAVNVNDVVNWSLELMRARAAEGKLTLQSSIEPGLTTIWADQRALRQLLLNLLSNATKFTPSGGQVKITARAIDNQNIRISVSDTGVGIPAEKIQDMFEPFTQVEQHDIHLSHPGTGLGLPICKSLVELHGGKLTIESIEEKGTTAHVTLPVNEQDVQSYSNTLL